MSIRFALVQLIPSLIVGAQARRSEVEDAPVTVRFSEGIVHGFLLLRNDAGAILARGDLRQTRQGDTVESRITFRFRDGSLIEESVAYTQQRVFTMRAYHLVLRGPVFEEDSEIRMNRARGTYQVTTVAHKDGKKEVHEGSLDLPPDTYNGMVLTVLKNLPKGGIGKIHVVAFTPKPRIVRVEIASDGGHRVLLDETERQAVHYVLKPKLGTVTGLLAKLLGRMPPDNHAWILEDEVPAFVRFVGSLYAGGPIWTIEQTTLRWPD